jgi:hypothetical protein
MLKFLLFTFLFASLSSFVSVYSIESDELQHLLMLDYMIKLTEENDPSTRVMIADYTVDLVQFVLRDIQKINEFCFINFENGSFSETDRLVMRACLVAQLKSGEYSVENRSCFSNFITE